MWRSRFLKLLVLIAVFAAFAAGYGWLNSRGSEPGMGHAFHPTPIERHPRLFLPWTAVIYAFAPPVLIFTAFLVNWPGRRFARAVLATLLAMAVAFAVYFAWPVVMTRGTYEGPGFGLWLMRNVVAVDDPANCFPSFHTVSALLSAILIHGAVRSASVRTLMWALAIAVAISTVTVGQHYYIDVAGGAVVAFLAAWAAARLIPGRAAST
jgi:membrane-associated phospholipid phosphatase